MSKFCEVNISSQNLGIFTFYFFYISLVHQLLLFGYIYTSIVHQLLLFGYIYIYIYIYIYPKSNN